MRSKNKKKGFTLIELIIALAVTAIVTTMVYQVFNFHTKEYKDGVSVNDVQNEGMLCINSISEAIRLSKSVDPPEPSASFTGLSGSKVPIKKITPYGGGAAYHLVIANNKLYKYTNSTSYSVIASNVSSAAVTSSGSVYTITVVIAKDGSTKTFSTSMSKRNRGV